MVSNDRDLVVEVMWDTIPEASLLLIREIDEMVVNWLPRLIFAIVRYDNRLSESFMVESRDNLEIAYRFSRKEVSLFHKAALVKIFYDHEARMYYPYAESKFPYSPRVSMRYICEIFDNTGLRSMEMMLGVHISDDRNILIGHFMTNEWG